MNREYINHVCTRAILNLCLASLLSYFGERSPALPTHLLYMMATSTTSVASNEGVRMCGECCTTTTSQWRYGHDGRVLLCNACGIRWRRKNRKASGAPTNPKPMPMPIPIRAVATPLLDAYTTNGYGMLAPLALPPPPVPAPQPLAHKYGQIGLEKIGGPINMDKNGAMGSNIVLAPLVYPKPVRSPISISSLLNEY